MNGDILYVCQKTTSYCVYPDNSYYHFPAYSSLEYKGTFGSINAVMQTGIVDLQTLTVVKYGKYCGFWGEF